MNPSQQELSDLKKRISEIMTTIDKEKTDLEFILGLITSLSNEDYDRITTSASSSLKKRDKDPSDNKTREEKITEMEKLRNDKQDLITGLWNKLHDLQQQDRDLEGKPRID